MIVTTKPCVVCDETTQMDVDASDFAAWQDGVNAQNVFYYMTAEERELLISGTHLVCWNSLFLEDDE